jgi:hypothetical protein
VSRCNLPDRSIQLARLHALLPLREPTRWRAICSDVRGPQYEKGYQSLHREARTLRVPCPSLLLALLLSGLLTVAQSKAGAESLMLPSAQWVTPVQLIPVPTRHGPGVRLEYGPPCLAEAGTRLRPLVHNFGRQGFVLVQYQTPYTAPAGHCPQGTLFFQPETELPHDAP